MASLAEMLDVEEGKRNSYVAVCCCPAFGLLNYSKLDHSRVSIGFDYVGEPLKMMRGLLSALASAINLQPFSLQIFDLFDKLGQGVFTFREVLPCRFGPAARVLFQPLDFYYRLLDLSIF